MNNEEELENDEDRERIELKIVKKMCDGEERKERNKGGGDGREKENNGIEEDVCKYKKNVEKEELEIERMKNVLENKKYLRKIFVKIISLKRSERKNDRNLRRIIEEEGIE